ncbi:MAG: hypothetical protein ABH840_02570 [Nanoarchaeota archaeon]
MENKKCLSLILSFAILSFAILVHAQDFNFEKLVLNSGENVDSVFGLISVDSLEIGDVFYLDDWRKARVSGLEDMVDEDNSVDFDNQNFFAKGVLVHNKLDMDFSLISNIRKQILDKGDLSLVQVGELDELERLYYSKVKLGREINSLEGEKILNAHYAEQGTGYKRIKIKYEELSGFSSEEIRILMENGIVGPGMTGPFKYNFASKVKQDILFINAAKFDHRESIAI